jgi:CBS domain-containing protein
MTRAPLYVRCGDTVAAALGTIAGRKISELPVLDDDGRPVGMIDITDLIASIPFVAERTQEAESAGSESKTSDLASSELATSELATSGRDTSLVDAIEPRILPYAKPRSRM